MTHDLIPLQRPYFKGLLNSEAGIVPVDFGIGVCLLQNVINGVYFPLSSGQGFPFHRSDPAAVLSRI